MCKKEYQGAGDCWGEELVVKREAGCGSAWLERLVWDQEAAGSNPVTPIAEAAEAVRRKIKKK